MKMYRFVEILVVAALSLGVLTACDTNDNFCTPGETQVCTCPGGATSSQRCVDDGSKWGVCRCGTGSGDIWTLDAGGEDEDVASMSDGGDTGISVEDSGSDIDRDASSEDGGGDEGTEGAARLIVQDRVTFSGVAPGTRATRKIALVNAGDEPLAVQEIRLTGSDRFTVRKAVDQSGESGDKEDAGSGSGAPSPSDDEPVSTIAGTSIAPGDVVELRIYFEPQDDQTEEGRLVIFTDAPDAGEKTVELTGNAGTPCLQLSHESSVRFGVSSTDQTATQTITVENCRPRAAALTIDDISVTDDGAGAYEVSGLPANLGSGGSYTLEGAERLSFVVEFSPSEQVTYAGELSIASNDPARTDHTIDLVGEGSGNRCPNAEVSGSVQGQMQSGTQISTLPLETIELDGSVSSDPDGSVQQYEWSIIDRPQDSTADLTPSSSVEQPKLFLDLAGHYTVELVVYDDQGTRSCGSRALVEIDAQPNEEISVQLVWRTPADADETDTNGTDLDLHYLNSQASEWNTAPWDIFWHNRSADWGQNNYSGDDPSLDIDDTDGAGPENINHDEPSSNRSYTVGVYYYDDNGFGPSYATVRIYIDGALQKEYKDKYLADTFDFWKTAVIDGASKQIYKRDKMFEDFPTP
jgi:hypothetical protein